MAVKFFAAKGTRFSDKDVQVAGKFLYSRYSSTFTPRDVLEAARPKSSPIHKYFDWDDKTAAEKYRLEQARRLVRAITIVVEDVQTRAFTSPIKVSVDNGKFTKGFFRVDKAIGNPDIWDQVLTRALEELESFELKYRNLKELKPVFSALTQIKERRKWQQKRSQKRPQKRKKRKS